MASADRLIEIFNEAKARPPGAERDHFLSEVGRDEPALKAQVLSLLKAHEGAGDFLRPTQLAPPASPLTEKPGDRIGRYKLLEQIGEGGCGVVYMADQEEPVRRRVALKVIKLGMDTKNVIARFEAERQVIAMMDHPNIAKVLDAGSTDTGRPYFVMELVRGIKITEYCDQNNLSTQERLALFIQVCQAIQHAHQKGIIHRDIKPSNILVTQNESVAVPKVIDFGIAKATTDQRLTDKTVFTAFEQFIGTPAYMSPEQAMMTSLDIDTRTDIYALGVLLYELLTGQTPFDARELMAAGLDAMRRIIREEEPVKPSTRVTQEFAKVGKWESEKVGEAARPPSDSRSPTFPPAHSQRRPFHDSRELQRLISTLRGDLDWIVMKALEKDRTRRYETANGLAADIQRHLNNEPVVARPPSRWYEFQKSVQRHKFGFAAAAALILVLALGVFASTWQALRATRAESEQTRLREQAENARGNEARERVKAEANEQKATAEAAKSRQVAQFMQDMLKGVGPSAALGRDTTMLREILEQTVRRLDELEGQPAVEADLRTTLGNVYLDLGEFTNAVAMHREALALWQKLLGNEHEVVATSLNGLASVLSRQGRHGEAETIYREALAMRRTLLGNEHLDVAESLNNLSFLLRDRGKLPEAEATARENLAICKKLLGDEHIRVAFALHLLAWNLNLQGKHAEAEALSREELAMRRKLLGDNHRDVTSTLFDLAIFLSDQSKWTEAEAVTSEVLKISRTVLGKENPDVAQSLHHLAWVFNWQGKHAEAEALSREALAMRRKLLGNEHPEVAATLKALATFLKAQGKSSEVETTLRECLSIREYKLPDTWLTFHSRSQLGGSLLTQKKYAAAEPWLLSGYEGMKERKDKVSGSDQFVRNALQRLVQLYEVTGQPDKVAGWKKELADFDQAEAEKKTAAPKP